MSCLGFLGSSLREPAMSVPGIAFAAAPYGGRVTAGGRTAMYGFRGRFMESKLYKSNSTSNDSTTALLA